MSESFKEELQKMIGFYHDDFNDDILRVQLRTLPAVIGQGEGSVNTFHDIPILAKQLKKPTRNLNCEVVKMIELVVVMPTTNAVSELSFSAMRCLYTYLRTNMGASRLNNAMELFGIIFNSFYFLIITTKNSILDVAGVLDPTLITDTFALHSWILINLKPILTSYRNRPINSNGKEDDC